MEKSDLIIEKYVQKITTRSLQKLELQFGVPIDLGHEAFKRLVENSYFMVLYQVGDVLVSIHDKAEAKLPQATINKKVYDIMCKALFGEGRIYRVLHQTVDVNKRSWDSLDHAVRSALKELYKSIAYIAYSAVVYWSGGSVNEKQAVCLQFF